MFKNVLVGVDGRPTGRDAIALATRLVDPEGKLTLAHVHSHTLSPLHAAAPGMIEGERKASHELLERERAGAEVSAELVSVAALSPGAGLHEQAESCQLTCSSWAPAAVGRLAASWSATTPVRPSTARPARSRSLSAATPITPPRLPRSASATTTRPRAPPHSPWPAKWPSPRAPPSTSCRWCRSPATPTAAPCRWAPSSRKMLEDANKNLAELPDIEGRAVSGLPGEELAGFGEQVDLLVVGSRGYGPLKRLVSRQHHHVSGASWAQFCWCRRAWRLVPARVSSHLPRPSTLAWSLGALTKGDGACTLRAPLLWGVVNIRSG